MYTPACEYQVIIGGRDSGVWYAIADVTLIFGYRSFWIIKSA